MIGRWTDSVPRWYKVMHSIMWIAPLALFVYVEPNIFFILANRMNQSDVATYIATVISISLSIAVLVSMPLLEIFVRSNAWLPAKIIMLLGGGRKTKKLIAESIETLADAREYASASKASLNGSIVEIDETLERLDREVPRQSPECDDYYSRLTTMRAKCEAGLSSLNDLESRREALSVNTERMVAENRDVYSRLERELTDYDLTARRDEDKQAAE